MTDERGGRWGRETLVDVTLPAELLKVSAFRDEVLRILRERGAAAGHEVDIELALQEALVNAIKHGCQNDPGKSIQCCVTVDDEGAILIVVRDPGDGFELASVPSPLSTTGLLRPSGRGVFLINQLMDEVRFHDRGREVHMRKAGRTVTPEVA